MLLKDNICSACFENTDDCIIHCTVYFQGEKVLQNDEFTKDLFRFLQLLCEGHNNGKWAGVHFQ